MEHKFQFDRNGVYAFNDYVCARRAAARGTASGEDRLQFSIWYEDDTVAVSGKPTELYWEPPKCGLRYGLDSPGHTEATVCFNEMFLLDKKSAYRAGI